MDQDKNNAPNATDIIKIVINVVDVATYPADTVTDNIPVKAATAQETILNQCNSTGEIFRISTTTMIGKNTLDQYKLHILNRIFLIY